MVPSGWKIAPFGELLESSNQGINTTTEKVIYSDKGIPAIRSNNVDEGRFNLKNEKFISEEEYARFSDKFKPNNSDILYCNIGSNLGAACINNLDFPFLITWNVFRAVPNKNKLNPSYGAIVLNWNRRNLRRYATESTMPFISSKVLLKYTLKLPPLPEQRKIAKILGTWDKAISTTECLIDNSKQQKKSLMQQLLTGKKRLLDDTDKPFDGELQRLSMSELATIDKESLGKKTPDNFEFNYISLSDVETGRISRRLEKHVFDSSPSRARRIVRNGDILLATVRPNLKGFAKAEELHDGMIASTGFSVLSPKKNVSGSYLYHYLFSCHLTGQINALVVGSNYPAINSSDVGGLKIYCPSYSEQQKIASVLNNADESIKTLEQQLSDLKQEKKALMQQLLTGKRRVKI